MQHAKYSQTLLKATSDMSDEFTHFNAAGKPYMVDVGHKSVTKRIAIAKGHIFMAKPTIEKIKANKLAKGDVLSVAQIAGVLGAKQTSNLIPLCHPLGLDHVDLSFEINFDLEAIEITSKCSVSGKTGIEMEALTAVSVAALTIYDMCKSVDKNMRIGDIRVTHKSGGKSGIFNAE